MNKLYYLLLLFVVSACEKVDQASHVPDLGARSHACAIPRTIDNDFYNNSYAIYPGDILPDSSASLEISKSDYSISMIDLTLNPVFKGKSFSSLEEFISVASLDPDFAKDISCRIYALAEFAGITTPDGFRLAATNKAHKVGGKFGFRFLAGEPLGDTVVPIIGGTSRCNTGIISYKSDYQPQNPFYEIVHHKSNVSHTIENERAMSFADIAPKAKIHRLAIPKGNYVSLFDFSKNASKEEIASFWAIVGQTIHDSSLSNSNFRVVTNAGLFANQFVGHLHMHIVGGSELGPLAVTCDDNPIFTTKRIINILPYIDKNTLVVFDIDQTLIMDPKHSGNVSFVIPRLDFVERQSKEVLKHVKARTDMIVGLSARAYNSEINDDAAARLLELGVPLDDSWLKRTKFAGLHDSDTNFVKGYKKGVFYSNFSAKSTLLLELLTELKAKNINVDRVVFVDDILSHCKDISNMLKQRKMPSRVFHYQPVFNQ